MIWSLWWVWVAAGIGLAILEIFAPGFVFLGFAVGAAGTGLLLGIGGAFSAWLAGSFPATILTFALISLVSWLIMRRYFGVRRGQKTVFDRDINED